MATRKTTEKQYVWVPSGIEETRTGNKSDILYAMMDECGLSLDEIECESVYEIGKRVTIKSTVEFV